MADTKGESAFGIPSSAHDFWALALALLVVVGLVQVGAPIVRELDFLDQKLRDYFIGIAFAAFPVIHRGCKQTVAGFKAQPVARHDLAPWFVTGAFAAALLFAWNLFVSFLGGFSIGIFAGAVGPANADEAAVGAAAMTSIMAVSLPLSAVASVFAGVLLNRHTRSNVLAALAFGAVLFIAFNLITTWALEPEFLATQFANASAAGAEGIVYFFVGMGLVAFIVFVFGGIGVLISHFYRESSIGLIMEAARRLPVGERDVLAGEISRRAAAVAAPRTAQPQAPPAVEP